MKRLLISNVQYKPDSFFKHFIMLLSKNSPDSKPFRLNRSWKKTLFKSKKLLKVVNFPLVWSKDMTVLIALMEAKFKNITDWLTGSGLQVNESKKGFCLFFKGDTTPINLSINGGHLTSTKSMNVVGVIFNSKLSWANHVSHVILVWAWDSHKINNFKSLSRDVCRRLCFKCMTSVRKIKRSYIIFDSLFPNSHFNKNVFQEEILNKKIYESNLKLT